MCAWLTVEYHTDQDCFGYHVTSFEYLQQTLLHQESGQHNQKKKTKYLKYSKLSLKYLKYLKYSILQVHYQKNDSRINRAI